MHDPWDYLILTAAHEGQARAYCDELEVRRGLGLLEGFRECLVVSDPGGVRVGSGGSTICCLLEILRRELAPGTPGAGEPGCWRDVFRRLRVLVLHAGGDSRRLPAYGPCGKLFVPLPGWSDGALGAVLFDRQLPVYRALPAPPEGAGQVVIASGDVLLGFAAERVAIAPRGVTGLGCYASPEQAAAHGVYCRGQAGRVRRFLQKPSPAEQAAAGATDAYGRAVLDVGVLSFDAEFAVRLLTLAGARLAPDAALAWSGPAGEAIVRSGLDFYREIGCALGEETTPEDYCAAVRGAGSSWPDDLLARLYAGLAGSPFFIHLLARCDFLHFGAARQIITSGQELVRQEGHFAPARCCVSVNNRLEAKGSVSGVDAWIEGCRIGAPLVLGGDNLVVGADLDRPLELPPGACLDLLPGRDREGRPAVFVRCYHVDDPGRKAGPAGDVSLCGLGLDAWLDAASMGPAEIWGEGGPVGARSLHSARLFPAVDRLTDFRQWLWMLAPDRASPAQWAAWREADRYSLEEMAGLADLAAFRRRRSELRADEARRTLGRLFAAESGFSAADLAFLLAAAPQPREWAAAAARAARRHLEERDPACAHEAFVPARILHGLGSALAALERRTARPREEAAELSEALHEELPGLLHPDAAPPPGRATAAALGEAARAAAFRVLRETIVASAPGSPAPPAGALRSDEIAWGRAPVRLDLAGGWTDTPPYSLERGGCVLNAAVDLNGQPPIQVYARVMPEKRVRLHSIDVGSDLVIGRWEDLLDYGAVTSEFSLVKAALCLCGFSPQCFAGAGRASLEDALGRFGGGLEITTLAAVPKGSGLGTSSIMGAVLLAVLHRVLGREISPTGLFHAVLRLEQELTTGGGWQDQIGGSVGGLKLIATQPGMVPEATVRFVPGDVLDPATNGGRTLLYYTGITRLAKNILQEVVGRYLDRDRQAVATLKALDTLAREMADALAQKDLVRAGRLIGRAWELNKQLDPNSTNPEIEAILARARPHFLGAKLLGAGGGGFLLMVCKTPEDAACIRQMLDADPPNPRARFFRFGVSPRGLEVSVC